MRSEPFQLNFKDDQLNVERFNMGGYAFFRISFHDKEPPFSILPAVNFSGEKFWTSMPEGQQKLAEEIGILIEQYYRAKK